MKFKKISQSDINMIDQSFAVLKENHESKSAIQAISDILHKSIGDVFDVRVVKPMHEKEPLLVMSVFPEMSTVDKIVSSVTSGESTFKTIQELWKKNSKWTVEIDERILGTPTDGLTNKELTAILLHEVGHVINSSSIPERIVVILQYEYAKASLQSKLLLRHNLFRSLLSIPILNSCICDKRNNKTNIKQEVQADSFVQKMGYGRELESALGKLVKLYHMQSTNQSEAMRQSVGFSKDILDAIAQRRKILTKQQFHEMTEYVSSPYLKQSMVAIYESLYGGYDSSSSIEQIQLESKQDRYVEEACTTSLNGYLFEEFVLFGRKKLEKIEPYTIDYIRIQAENISSKTDKLMLLSYIHNKLNIIDSYLAILHDPKELKKYRVPHSEGYLLTIKKELMTIRDMVIKYKIPPKPADIFVGYPTGYEG